MFSLRLRIAGAIAAVAILASSCGDSSLTAPPPAAAVAPDSAQADLLGGLQPITKRLGLLTCRPMRAQWATEVIGPAGGEIEVGPHVLRIPPRALDRPTRITAHMPTDDVNRVEFWPHGLEFDRPAQLTMSYANCDIVSWILPKRVAYINDNQNILYYLLSLDNILSKKVTGRVDHFSEYAIAW